ncbi:hypothetical protein V1511DRAFT_500545, partial [Dipodascopsis uninucleata]
MRYIDDDSFLNGKSQKYRRLYHSASDGRLIRSIGRSSKSIHTDTLSLSNAIKEIEKAIDEAIIRKRGSLKRTSTNNEEIVISDDEGMDSDKPGYDYYHRSLLCDSQDAKDDMTGVNSGIYCTSVSSERALAGFNSSSLKVSSRRNSDVPKPVLGPDSRRARIIRESVIVSHDDSSVTMNEHRSTISVMSSNLHKLALSDWSQTLSGKISRKRVVYN